MDQQRVFKTEIEKSHHYTYLRGFRVDQCQLFLQNRCKNHRPFDCFNWHFLNQRRRRPVRSTKNGKFNYCPVTYCSKYDEETGICPDGDGCPLVHRTFGDVERRYHLRYYKTSQCDHDVDARGCCVKNGRHCAFAHGSDDQRPAVCGIKDIAVERNDQLKKGLASRDPKWQDTNYVLTHYKTEPCTRPPNLCRQDYSCPHYHTSKDKRRNPEKISYRVIPCLNVKHDTEWGEPANCEYGDNCQYCHTQMEQRFHPSIYKTTKCSDRYEVSCPRNVFCTFSHEPNEEPPTELEDPSTLGASAATKNKFLKYDCNNILDEGSESASAFNVGSNHSHSEALEAQLQNQNHTNGNYCQSSMNSQSIDFTKQLLRDPMIFQPCVGWEKKQSERVKFTDSAGKYSDPGLEDLGRWDLSRLEKSISDGFVSTGLLQNTSESRIAPNSISKSGLLQNTSTPVQGIPLNNFNPSNHSYMTSIREPFSRFICSTPIQYQSGLISPMLERLSIPELSVQHSKPPIMNNPINEMLLREKNAQKMRFEDRMDLIQITQAFEACKTAIVKRDRKI